MMCSHTLCKLQQPAVAKSPVYVPDIAFLKHCSKCVKMLSPTAIPLFLLPLELCNLIFSCVISLESIFSQDMSCEIID